MSGGFFIFRDGPSRIAEDLVILFAYRDCVGSADFSMEMAYFQGPRHSGETIQLSTLE